MFFAFFALVFLLVTIMPIVVLFRRYAPRGGRAQSPTVGKARGRYGASGETAGVRWTLETGAVTQGRGSSTRLYTRWRTDAAALPADALMLMAGLGGKVDPARVKFGDPDAAIGSMGGITGMMARAATRFYLNAEFGRDAGTAADDRLHRVKTPPPALADYHVMTTDDAVAATHLAEPVPSIVAAWETGGIVPAPSILLWNGGLMLSFEGVEVPTAAHERVAALGSALALAWKAHPAPTGVTP